ncbi:DUF5908 family protein [Chitinophaga sp. XS-30]|uniref:DUF5908 family protein n=1 Tax=Chitinophaga sp. XS-30 TaxID=2604421 RepID=UPI0011DD0E09|nr:DUF5908 family protein [Chitinophaga sp. XS-30]QEH43694.1 hypothetical protein FW415_23690 [Chitinophaga sp. XS-30]
MPIEVRELVIKARVEDPPQGASGSSGSAGTSPRAALSEWELQRIVALCAEEVMKILKRQKER